MGVMVDVARNGPHGGELRLLCWGLYAELHWTQQNLRFNRHYSGNSNANDTSLDDV